ncbi:MAG TPA: hypothetical protein VFA87_09455 [Rhizomicrobium sp.]|nr:hypothetical protein [Rhizomicrobium sp.]
MAKIPVEHTISSAYSFAFRNILTVAGIAWLPYVLAIAITAGLVVAMVPGLAAPGGPSPAAIAGLIAVAPLIAFVFLVANAMVIVGIMRRALGLSSGPVLAYFSLSAPVWRMLGANILVGLVVVVMIAVEIAVIAAVLAAATSGHNGALGLLSAILIFAACLWTIYFMVRIAFFLPAVVVAEERIGIGRSWELGKGNFWRIFVVWLAITIPVSMAASILMQAVYGNALMGLVLAHQGETADPAALLNGLVQILVTYAPYLILIQLLELIIMSGLTNGAIAAAYRSVTGTGGAGQAARPSPTPA